MNIPYYVETNVICVVILLLFRSHLRRQSERFSTDRMVLNRLIWATVVFCVADIVGTGLVGFSFRGARLLIEAGNMIYFESLTVITYLWMLYVLIKLRNATEFNRKEMFLLRIPLIVFTLVDITNPFTHILFSVDENSVYIRNGGVTFHWIVTWMYLVLPTAQTVLAIAQEKSKQRREELVPLLYFIVAPVVACVAQMMFFGVTSAKAGVTISIAMICLAQQNQQVLTDALTGLNNRRGLDRYLERHVQHATEQPLTLLMIDINSFKQINDKFGHLMGDAALRDVAEALRMACREGNQRMFLCRYGGDEFVIAGTELDAAGVAELRGRICEELQKCLQKESKPFSLVVSVGTATGLCAAVDDAQALLREADAAMYRDKKRPAS
ncbi:MAG: GGDEF domain-containing protein [Oscillospiraceae bacterium]|nr:GGDEF domain-containing protein [Oscillospiraceae bacterium]